MEDPKEIILKTEYSNRFDEVRKNLVVQSYFKYGKASRNFVSGYVDAIGSLKKCIQKFEETGNLEYLAGQIVGWIYDKKNPIGDNYVDFGIYDTSKEANRNFVNGYERTILLDFNVDGNILDLM